MLAAGTGETDPSRLCEQALHVLGIPALMDACASIAGLLVRLQRAAP